MVLFSCDSSITLKQSAFFAPEFGVSSYNSFTTQCNYSFSKNKIARIEYLDNCNFNIVYDNLNCQQFGFATPQGGNIQDALSSSNAGVLREGNCPKD